MTSRPEPFGSTWAGSFLENIDQSTLCDAQCLMARPFPPAYIQTMSFRNISIILAIILPIGIAAESAIPKRLGAFVEKHCVDCHEGAEANSGLDFYKLGFDLSKEETARRWILVYDRLLKGEMPPPKKRRPEADESKAILKLLAESITESEQERTQVVLRRLNRREYENTSRDLFQADVSVKGLPDDTSTDGFDNVGEGLAVSAEAMQAYLEAADQVLDAVFGTPEKPKFIRHETNLLEQVDWKGRPQLESQIGKMFRKTDDGLVIFQSYYCPTNLVMHLALETDSTRFLTYNIPGMNSVPVIRGVDIDYHNLSHHGKDPAKIEQLTIVESAVVRELGAFLEKLDQSKEAGGSLLDSSMVLFGSNLGNASSHDTKNMPIILAGGGFKHGQHLAFDRENNYPLPKLYVSMLQRLGLEADTFATGSGTMRGLDEV